MVPNNRDSIAIGFRPCQLSLENFIALAGLEANLGQTWSNMVPKNRQSIEMGLRPCRFSVENFSALAGLEVKLGQTWSQHSPNMVLLSRHSLELVLDHVYSALKISVL